MALTPRDRKWTIRQVNAQRGLTHPQHVHPRHLRNASKLAVADYWREVEQRGGEEIQRK